MGLLENKGRFVLVIWAVGLAIFYLAAAYLAGTKVYEDKISSEIRQQQRLDPTTTEQGKTQVDFSELKSTETGDFEAVKVGMYVDRIMEISTKATAWTVDFYIWFNWQSDAIKPGETFQIIDGEIQSRTKVEELIENGRHYALYRVTARITKFFNVVRYPLDNHLLTIRIEDRDHQWNELRYVPDVRGAEYSSRVKVPSYRLNEAEIINKPHAYKTSRGDPRLAADHKATYSQITYGIKIDRPDWGLYFKMFQGLFASVAIAFLAFILGSTSGQRFGLGVGAFFAAVGSSYVNLSELPGVGMVTLIDMANGLAMTTIFLTLLGSVLSSRIARGESQLGIAQTFDRISLALFLTGFVSVNVVMALLASI